MYRRQIRKRRNIQNIFLFFFLTALIFGTLVIYADHTLRGQLYAMAAMQACEIEESTINQSVLSTLKSKDVSPLIRIEQNNSGTVTSIQTDSVQINLLKSEIMQNCATALKSHTETVRIPCGSLTKLDILSGIGPEIKIPVRTVGYVSAEIKSEFESAGINQTIHRLNLYINANLCLSMAKSQEQKAISFEMCISETVIVGTVPQVYAFHENGE